VFTIGDAEGRNEVFAIRLPNMLSLLAYNQLTGEVKGINDLQAEYVAKYGEGDYVPPAWIIYWTFRAMVGAGFLMVALAAYALFLSMGEMLEKSPRLLKFFTLAMVLPYIGTASGWLMTEIGRSPWVVYGLMKAEDGLSTSVTPVMVLISLIGFTLVYGVLMAADIYLMVKNARAGAGSALPTETAAPVPSLVGAD
jgi:cytochrome d ubiquinol oxidase subunit I